MSTGYRTLSRAQLDVNKYDHCVYASKSWRNPIYGYSWYLDCTASLQWHAVVWGDYEAVAPVVSNRKLIWRQVAMPLLTQQLGCFAPSYRSHLVADLINHLRQYRRCAYQLPYDKSLKGELRSNYQLALPKSYDSYVLQLSKVRRKTQGKVPPTADLDIHNNVQEHITFCLDALAEKVQVSKGNRERITALFTAILNRDKGHILTLREGSRILASSLVSTEAGFSTLLMGASTLPGKKLRAREHLIHKTVEKAIELGHHTLDFEGSDIPGVANFFASFGAKDYKYMQVCYDNMPWVIQKLRPL